LALESRQLAVEGCRNEARQVGKFNAAAVCREQELRNCRGARGAGKRAPGPPQTG